LPRLQTFEGDELEAVLAKVRLEAGANARVLEAKKVRDGGIGGFFAKERFVLIVEVVDEAPAAARPRPAGLDLDAPLTAPPSSILELADLMDEAEARELTLVGAQAAARPAAEPAERLAPLPPIMTPAPMHRAPLVQVPTEREPERLPSTESDSFQDVLARLAHASEVPMAPVAPVADEVIETIDVETLGFERFDVTSFASVEDDVIDEVRPFDHEQEDEIDVEIEDEIDEVLDEPAIVEDASEVAMDEEVVLVPEVIEMTTELEPATAMEIELEDAAAPAVRATNPLVRVRRTPTTFERTVGMGLLELGLPAAYVPDIEGAFTNDDVRNAILTALRLPKPPALPLGNNAIVAVVGERRAAISLAEQLADEPALNGAIVKVADRQGFTLIDGGSATADERGIRQRPTRTVVAVPSMPGMTSDWTRDLLDRLEPDMVWGVVPASRKSEDVASWAIQLGGLDVLALTGLGKTVSPATSLRLGIPVGLIDGQCATTEAWADLLTERLVAA
jgi:hypothetical protein